MKVLAIIPARGGSKRIPKKNIKLFLGQPIMTYSISAVIKSGCFDEVMVSTDDKEIADIARLAGAKVPFMRSRKNSNDCSTTADVVMEVLREYEKRGFHFDNFCCIYPTAPFIRPSSLKLAMSQLNKNDIDSVAVVVRFSHPIQRAFRIENGLLKMVQPKNMQKRSQDFEPTFHDAGQFYFLKTEKFLKSKKLFTKSTMGIEMPELKVHDIDSESDWKIAEIKYKFKNRKV